MRIFKFFISLFITLGLIYALDNRWVINGNPIPPIGKFLDPFNGCWRSIESPHTRAPEALTIPGLQEPVIVVFDSLAIPHIFARNDLDLYFAQGYITARHRLWQMEFLTHAAAGRVSEIAGPGKDNAILNYDRGQRRLGMVYAAQHAMEKLSKDQDAMIMIEKYTEGVNAYIQTLNYKSLPFEYKLLHYKPEPWTALKCALLSKSMAQSLNIGDKDIEMTNALHLFGKEMLDVLYPDQEAVGDPIVDDPKAWRFKPTIPDSIPLALPDELIHVKKLPGPDPTTGSNNWAVSGKRTATGTPILSGDPHLNLGLPSLWYLIQLNAPGINTMGASLPGVPCVIIGATDSIAWSMTNAQRDVVDWFKITFQDDTHSKYRLDDQWMDTKKVVEKFAVRDQPVQYDTVIYTHWGPITYDDNFGGVGDKKYYAFRWISHDPSDEFLAYYKLNRAHNLESFDAALDHFVSPAQNFVFASIGGDIAMRIQGKYPQRRAMEGKFVLDGSKSSNGWNAFIPNEQNIRSVNPPRGFVSSANQYPVDATYPYYITGTSFEAYRNRRINSLLLSMDSIQPQDMMELQTDNFNLKASESLPYFLQQLDTATLEGDEKQAYTILSHWDYYNTVDAEGASYYESWWENLMALVWDEMDVDGTSLRRPSTYTTIKLLREKPALDFFDILQTPEKETGKDVIRKAFSISVDDIDDWKVRHGGAAPAWGDYKDAYIGHLLRIGPLGIHVRAPGNKDIINAHSRTHGPSWRMIVSLENTGVRMWGVYPGGQSGNPGSPYYSNMLAPWVNGGYFPLTFLHNPAEADDKTFYTLHLKRPD